MHQELIGRVLEPMTLKISDKDSFNVPEDFKGHWTVLYFYPKDDTPGCTVQACSYRDNISYFKNVNARIIGVSADDISSHERFIGKFDLNFPLIADTEKKLHEALAVKSRDTFLINPDGEITKVWRGVSPQTTVQETLEAIGQ